MNEQRLEIPIRSRPKPVRTIGSLNMLFGTVLIGYAWTMFSSMAFSGMSIEPNRALERALGVMADREHRETLDRLAGLEASAKSEAAREVFREERLGKEEKGPTLRFEAQLVTSGMHLKTFATWSVFNYATAFVLNLLMIASGVGLLQRVEWGRKLGLWAAGAKLARLVIVYGFFMVLVVPPLSRELGEAVGGQLAAQGGGMPAGMPNMTQVYAVMYTAIGVSSIVLGAIYPIITLVMLAKPGVRAACAPADIRAKAILIEAGRA